MTLFVDQPFPQSSPLHNENISFYRLFYMWQESGKLLRIYSGKRRLNANLTASWCFKRFCFSEIPIFFQKLSYLEEKIMSQNESYHVNESLRNDLRLRKILDELPEFASRYFYAPRTLSVRNVSDSGFPFLSYTVLSFWDNASSFLNSSILLSVASYLLS